MVGLLGLSTSAEILQNSAGLALTMPGYGTALGDRTRVWLTPGCLQGTEP